MSAAPLTRRAFGRLAALSGAGLLLSRSAAAQLLDERTGAAVPQRILSLGAGLAGLAAATKLIESRVIHHPVAHEGQEVACWPAILVAHGDRLKTGFCAPTARA